MDDGTLGVAHNEAVVYERGGTRRLFTVPAVASVEWNRTLDGISRATVVCTPEAASRDGVAWAGGGCAGLLSTIHPWAHELVIYRNGSRVWEGPVRRPMQNRAGVQIAASDVLGWTERRVTPARTVTGSPIRDEALAALAAVYDGTDLNVSGSITSLGDDTAVIDLDVKAAGGYYSGLLSTLASAGLYYTTVGRRVIVWADPTVVLGLTGDLNPALHIVGDVETAREGDTLTTRAYGVNDDSEVGADGGSDAFYGLVERTVSLPGVVGPSALAAGAAAWRTLRYPAPESLTLPAGAALHCDAPFPIPMLVPGVLTQVNVLDLCWPVQQTMMLTALKVTEDANGEKVGVTYTPIAASEDTA